MKPCPSRWLETSFSRSFQRVTSVPDFFNKVYRTSTAVWPAGLKPGVVTETPSAAAVGSFLTRPPSVAAVNSTSFSRSYVVGCQRKLAAFGEGALFAQLAFHDSPATQTQILEPRSDFEESEVKEKLCFM